MREAQARIDLAKRALQWLLDSAKNEADFDAFKLRVYEKIEKAEPTLIKGVSVSAKEMSAAMDYLFPECCILGSSGSEDELTPSAEGLKDVCDTSAALCSPQPRWVGSSPPASSDASVRASTAPDPIFGGDSRRSAHGEVQGVGGLAREGHRPSL